MGEVDNIDVDYTDIETALGLMRAEMKTFSDINDKVFNSERNKIGEMNADFATKYAKILKKFPEWISKKLLKELDTICNDAETIMGNLQGVDEAHNQSRLGENNG